MFSLIVAVGKNNEIGKNNQLLWHIPEDLKNFKKITTGKTVIMGRNTYKSIGRALPNRTNIVLSRNFLETDEKFKEDKEVVPSDEKVLGSRKTSSFPFLFFWKRTL